MPQTAVQEAIGNSQQMFADNVQAKRQELIDSGACVPCSVVNFNPVPLTLQGELRAFSVPSAYDDRLPSDVLRFTLDYEGKKRRGHAITIRFPHFYGRNVSAQWHQGGGPGDAIVQRDAMYYLPVALGYMLLEHFSPIFVRGPGDKAAPPPKDLRGLYGVLAFRGDIHHLQSVLNEPEPEKRRIQVPLAVVRTTGKIVQRSYTWAETGIDDYLEKMFAGQRQSARAKIMRAHQRWNGTEVDRNDISEIDRVWYRWAISLGYAEAPEKGKASWLYDELAMPAPGQAAAPTLRKCQSCRTPEPEPGTPFCPKCAAPISTFDTFMAGFPVAEAWLQALKGEEREIVLEELRTRKEGFGAAESEFPTRAVSAISSESKPAKPLTGAAAKSAAKKAEREAAQESKPAVMPGEE